MKKCLLAACIFVLMTANAGAAQIDLTVSYEGTVSHDIAKITDGYFPVEEVWDGGDTDPAPDRWNGVNNVPFHGNEGHTTADLETFYFDLGGLYRIEDVKLSVDNNDRYDIEYLYGSDWVQLFTIFQGYGSAARSMDNFSTVSTDSANDYDSRIDFTAVETSKLRLYAYKTTNDNWFSIGEFQVFGSEIPSENDPAPEPATMLLFGLGLLGLSSISRKRKQ